MAVMSFSDPQVVRVDVRALSAAMAEIVAERLRAVLSQRPAPVVTGG
jgi:hypothetical protein